MCVRTLVAGAAIVGLVIMGPLAAPAPAQERGKGRQQNREKMPSEGKLVGAMRGLIKVQTEDGGQWLVALGRNAQQSVSVVGQADANWLRPGMLIRFSSRFDRKGEAVAPVQDLSVVTMREGMRFGATPENVGGFGGAGKGLFADNEESPPRKKTSRPKPAKPEDYSYTVVAKITKIRKGEISVAAGSLLKFKLAEKPRIDVDVADISIASPGDSVKVDAWYLPNQPGRAMANKVTIALAKPLAATPKRRSAAPSTEAGKKNAPEAGDKKQDGEAKDGEAKDGAR